MRAFKRRGAQERGDTCINTLRQNRKVSFWGRGERERCLLKHFCSYSLFS